jgi:hypothetical protein
MRNPTILKYVYYHCTKRKNPGCTQGSIEVKGLEEQIGQYLAKIQISERFKDWTVKHLKEENEKETPSRETILCSQRKAYDSCLRKINNLFQLKISPLNTDGSLLSDEEYGKQRAELLKEKVKLQGVLNDVDERAKRSLEMAEETFDLACHARYDLASGTPEKKGEILQRVGSNLNLKAEKLNIQIKKPLVAIGRVVRRVPQVRPTFEPKKFGLNERDLEEFFSKNPIVRCAVDDVRTFYLEDQEY